MMASLNRKDRTMKTLRLRTTALPGIAALSLVAGTMAAVAATQTITDADELKEMRGVQSATVKLDEIIARAEAKSDARAFEAGAETVKDGVHYIVETRASDGATQELHYGLDGKFLTSTPDEPGDDEDSAATQAFANAEVTLGEAVAKAVQETGGTALEAELEGEDGNLVIEVETVKGDRLTELRIDAVSGKVMAPAADDEKGGEREDDRD